MIDTVALPNTCPLAAKEQTSLNLVPSTDHARLIVAALAHNHGAQITTPIALYVLGDEHVFLI
ncbi:MAG: hypothetical protein ACXW36_11690, partial [Nitrospira sp.]